MKIAFINLYSGINDRGAESFSHELAGRLGKSHEVKFFRGIDYSVPAVQPTSSANLRKLLFIDGAAISVLRFSLKIIGELRHGEYDWVVPMNGFWQVLICKLLIKSKMLITGHSGPGWDEKWNLWLKPDVFVATTQPTARWAKKISPWTRVETIPYGVDVEKFAAAKPTKINLERPIFLCPAALVEYKRIDLAIKAVAKLKKGSLLHLGTGPDLEEILKLGNKLLGNNRFESTSVAYEKIPAYYQASNVVTLPSRPQENSPMVFLEAMAAGKFVVTTDTPRNRWVLGDAGSYVDPTNLTAYAKALADALKRRDHEVIEKQIQQFSWENIVQRYLNLLEKLDETI